jgi:hypothetical protein
MATQPRPLSNKVKWAIEDSRRFLAQIREAVRDAQEENIKGNQLMTGMYLGDIREACSLVDELLHCAYTGEYMYTGKNKK